jgi:glutathione S-transferase
MKLYDASGSGNCYKVRLFAALTGIDLKLVPVDLASGQNREPSFLKLNPRGHIPVLDHDGRVLWESQAILVYMARQAQLRDWFPDAIHDQVAVMQWLAVAGNECLFGLSRARAVLLFNRPWDMAQSQALGIAGLKILDARLSSHEWLATDRPTVADVACYPYAALAPEGDISLDPFANVRRWIGAIQKLPGYISMPGIEPQA